MPFTYAGQLSEAILSSANPASLRKNTPVTVLVGAGPSLATIYLDRARTTPAPNPISSDGSGMLSFFGDPGQYTLVVGTSKVAITIPVDPADASGNAVAARHIIAGAGLVGGGDLTADRTISMPAVGPGAVGPIGDASHTSSVSTDVEGRVTALTATPITVAESAVTGLVADLAAKAPLASPPLTGAPTAPTAAPGTNSTVIASTAYADAATAVETARAEAAEATKATDTLVVHLAGTETVTGAKAFTGGVTSSMSPVGSTDLVRLSDLQSYVAGLSATESPAQAVAMTNVAALTGLPVIGSYQTIAVDRVLLTGQTTASQNGLWVTAAGAWTRPADFAHGADVRGTLIDVEDGSVWVLPSVTAVIVDTTAQSWQRFDVGALVAGAGLTKSGNTVSVVFGTTSGTAAQGNDARFAGSSAGTAGAALAATDATTTNSRAPSGAAAGDLSGTYPNPTLKATGPGATGPTGDATHTPAVTIDAQGRVTALSSTAIAIPESAVTGLVSDLAAKAATASLGTAATQNKVAAGSPGVLDATDATTTNSRAPTGTAGGDLAGTYPNPTLKATGPGATGPAGDASHVPAVTIDAQGRVTALSSTAIAIPESAVTGLVTDLGAKAATASPTFTGTVTAPRVAHGVNAFTVTTGAYNIDASLGDHQIITLGGNVGVATITNPVLGQEVVFEFKQDGTGSRTYTLPANLTLLGQTWTSSTAAGARDVVKARYDGAAWIEIARGQNTNATGGVSSFNTRSGAVTLSKADVTGTGLAAADVGADVSGAAAAAQTASLQKSANLSDVGVVATARTNLGLGTAATQNKVAAGSPGVLDATDATTTNSRAPSGSASGDLAGSYPNPTVAKVNGASLAALATGLLKNTTTTGVPSIATAADVPTVAAGGTGPLSATDATTTNSRAPSGSAAGDLAGTYPNPTLKATGPGATGPTGDATHVPAVTIDAQGRVTALSSTAIAIPESAVTGLVSDLAAKVASFNTRTGVVTLTAADLTALITQLAAGSAALVAGGTTLAPTIDAATLDVIANTKPAAADWSNNSHKITSVLPGTAATDAANVGQLSAVSVKQYGAKCDGKVTFDGAITSGSPNLTATGTFVAGQLIVVKGAGTAGADLATTVLTGGTNSCVLAANAATTVAGTRTVADGAISTGTNTLADATSTPYLASDVGRQIQIAGARSDAGTLVGIVTAFTNSGHVTTSRNAGSTVSAASVTILGAAVIWGTDDTTAVNNALAANPSVLVPGVSCCSAAVTGAKGSNSKTIAGLNGLFLNDVIDNTNSNGYSSSHLPTSALLYMGGGATSFFDVSTAGPLPTTQPLNGLLVKNLGILHASSTFTGKVVDAGVSNATYTSYATRLRFERCGIGGWGDWTNSAQAFYTDGCWGVTFHDCAFANYTTGRVCDPSGLQFANNITFESCMFALYTTAAVTNASEATTFVGCEFMPSVSTNHGASQGPCIAFTHEANNVIAGLSFHGCATQDQGTMTVTCITIGGNANAAGFSWIGGRIGAGVNQTFVAFDTDFTGAYIGGGVEYPPTQGTLVDFGSHTVAMELGKIALHGNANVTLANSANATINDSGTPTPWIAFTAAITNITRLTVGNGTVAGRYKKIGKTLIVAHTFTAGSTTAYSAANLEYSFTLPASFVAANQGINYWGNTVYSKAGFWGSTVNPFVCGVQPNTSLVHVGGGNVAAIAAGSATGDQHVTTITLEVA